jgi:hypothetical protein
MMINNLEDLAHKCTFSFDPRKHTLEDAKRIIAKNLFKYTKCGISFYMPSEESVCLAGYCEGSDREHEVYELKFPFKEEDFDKAVDQADADGCATWFATHGCEECWPEGTCDEWGNEFPPGEVGGPINPECKGCEGEGTLI